MRDGLFVVFGEVGDDGGGGQEDGEEFLRGDPEGGWVEGGAVEVGGEEQQGFQGRGDGFGGAGLN